MQTPEVKANTEKFIRWFCEKFQQGELDNDSILEFYKVVMPYLNPETISDHAKRTGLTYPGVQDKIKTGKLRTETLFGIKFIIDNE